jgi:hypothetical protein
MDQVACCDTWLIEEFARRDIEVRDIVPHQARSNGRHGNPSPRATRPLETLMSSIPYTTVARPTRDSTEHPFYFETARAILSVGNLT